MKKVRTFSGSTPDALNDKITKWLDEKQNFVGVEFDLISSQFATAVDPHGRIMYATQLIYTETIIQP